MGGRNSGKRRMPQALKEAVGSGSANDRRRGALSPRVAGIPSAPPPPDELHPIGREEWTRVAILMCDVGMLTELDLGTLFAYCDAFALARRTDVMMKKLALADPVTEGIVVQSPGGAAYLNPLMGVQRQAVRDMIRYAGELGLTPSSRAKIVVTERGGMGRAKAGGPSAPKGIDIAAKYGI